MSTIENRREDAETIRIQCAPCGTIRDAKRNRTGADGQPASESEYMHPYLPACACGAYVGGQIR